MFFIFKVIKKNINPLNRPSLSLLVILILGFILRSLKLIHVGVWVDEGIYFYEAWMLLEGKIPYTDFFKLKPLGIIYVISILFYFLGKNVIAARILTSLVNLWTCFFIYLLGKVMYNQKIGFLAAMFYTFDPLVILFSYHVYMEPYTTLFVVLSAYSAIIGKKRANILWYFASGIFVGISFFMKQPGIIIALVIIPFIFYSPVQKSSLCRRFLKLLFLLGGLLIVLLLSFAYYFSIGILDEFLYYNFTFHSAYTGTTTSLLGRLKIIRTLVLDNIILWMAGIGAIPILLKNRRDVDIFTLSFFLISFVVFIPLLTPYPHYFVQSTPPLCILAGYSLNKFFNVISESKIKIAKKFF